MCSYFRYPPLTKKKKTLTKSTVQTLLDPRQNHRQLEGGGGSSVYRTQIYFPIVLVNNKEILLRWDKFDILVLKTSLFDLQPSGRFGGRMGALDP